MNVGILGLKNSGKKSLFHLLTNIKDHNIGTSILQDERLDFIYNLYKPAKKTNIHIQFILIPDITKDSEQTKKALINAKDCDILLFLVRAFKDENVYHPFESIDPKRDLEFILNEIIFYDFYTIETRLEKIEKQLKAKKEDLLLKEKDVLLKLKTAIENKKFLSYNDFQESEIKILSGFKFLSLKPSFVVINCDENELKKEFKLTENLKEINISVKIEDEILQLNENESLEYLKLIGMEQPALERVIRTAFESGDYITFFTVNDKEAKAWAIKKGLTALKAAGVIHSDFEKGFIKAEVINFDDLKKAGSEHNARVKGLFRLEGKDYIVKDGDIIKFKFNI